MDSRFSTADEWCVLERESLILPEPEVSIIPVAIPEGLPLQWSSPFSCHPGKMLWRSPETLLGQFDLTSLYHFSPFPANCHDRSAVECKGKTHSPCACVSLCRTSLNSPFSSGEWQNTAVTAWRWVSGKVHRESRACFRHRHNKFSLEK